MTVLKEYKTNIFLTGGNMKGKIKIISILIVSVLLLATMIFVINIGGAQIAEGKYKIVGYKEYPNAYIEVKGNYIKFYNIDLNAIYQDGQVDNYVNMIEAGYESDLSDEQVKTLSDLNEMYVNNSYMIDYQDVEDNKNGTFSYIYFCLQDDHPFGFVLEYNSFDKTIQINSPIKKLLFERE